MQISSEGLALIKQFEGFSERVYRCPAGYPTIGYGHVVHPSDVILQPMDRKTAEQVLRADLQLVAQAVQRLIPIPLLQHQFDALCSFTYNLGAGSLQRSRLRQCMLRADVMEASAEFGRWVYVNGRKSPGLIARRKAEAALFGLAY